ncbi:MAG TPA: DegT/DnrJ/EryC1/StrS family aminotransferase [Thermoanaerobaculia bacterium]|nr:DegT/DnrJ/EryC1/StrS family aminotransferase [Thermoanaerobaculia bacterium]
MAVRTASILTPEFGWRGSPALPSDCNASGRSLGWEELAAVRDALSSGVLSGGGGRWVSFLEQGFSSVLGTRYAFASASGSSAVQVAIAAIDPEPGDEIIVSPIADMDVLMPILYQGAVPMFADVDPLTGTLTADTIRGRISARTRAVLVTHLFGQPCEMAPIMSLAAAHRLPVIEDCSQALLAEAEGAYTGTLGLIGCFSLHQDRHLTCGEGGVVVTANDEVARRLSLCINQAFEIGEERPDCRFLALQSRMTELQAAVAVAQLEKMQRLVTERMARAAQLSAQLEEVPGITLPRPPQGARHSYWRFALRVHPDEVPGGAAALGELLAVRGVRGSPRCVSRPAFRHGVFSDQKTFGNSRYPFSLARPEALDYRSERYPGTDRFLRDVLVVPLNERFADEDVSRVAAVIRDSVAELRAGNAL